MPVKCARDSRVPLIYVYCQTEWQQHQRKLANDLSEKVRKISTSMLWLENPYISNTDTIHLLGSQQARVSPQESSRRGPHQCI